MLSISAPPYCMASRLLGEEHAGLISTTRRALPPGPGLRWPPTYLLSQIKFGRNLPMGLSLNTTSSEAYVSIPGGGKAEGCGWRWQMQKHRRHLSLGRGVSQEVMALDCAHGPQTIEADGV